MKKSLLIINSNDMGECLSTFDVFLHVKVRIDNVFDFIGKRHKSVIVKRLIVVAGLVVNQSQTKKMTKTKMMIAKMIRMKVRIFFSFC